MKNLNLNFDENSRIAFVLFEGITHIYCMDRWTWVLDKLKWYKQWHTTESGESDVEIDYSERFGLLVLNEKNISEFLAKTREYEVPLPVMKKFFAEKAAIAEDWWAIQPYIPVLHIDFDRRHLGACYNFDDGPHWENYVPDGWVGEFINFLENYDEDLLQTKYKYWIVNGRNFLHELTT